eukprot:5315879-Alexandrium_andersonii.AAC.1
MNRIPTEPSSEANRSNRVAPTLVENPKIAAGARTWNCAGPGTASTLIPEAHEGCVLRSCSR